MRHSRLTAVLLMLAYAAVPSRAQDGAYLTIRDLQRMSLCELDARFRHADVGTPLVGQARGRLLCSTAERHPRLEVWRTNAVWKGKSVELDGHFVNRWLGGIHAIASQTTVGPSWVDGRPALLMEYAPGTPLLANTHDELREVAPGLYLGPLYDRCPHPVLRGYLALELQGCGR